MRITRIAGNGKVARLRVEGRITQQTVEELRSSCEACLAEQRTLLLDLSGVRFVDPSGIDLLRDLERGGSVMIGCSGFVSELLRVDSPAPAVLESVHADECTSDAALLKRLRRGDDEAFERLVRQYGGRMLATARRMLGSEDDAGDAVQEAFLSAFKAIGTFKGTAKLSTWLHRILINSALMKIRSRRRRPEEPIDDLLPRFDEQGGWVDGVASWQAPTDLLLERRETRAMVRRCIDRLPESYRTVLLFRDIEELDTEEAADILGVTPTAVKVRLHRARQALRTLLERELGGLSASPAHPASVEHASQQSAR